MWHQRRCSLHPPLQLPHWHGRGGVHRLAAGGWRCLRLGSRRSWVAGLIYGRPERTSEVLRRRVVIGQVEVPCALSSVPLPLRIHQ
jgi:hypothetical protein